MALGVTATATATVVTATLTGTTGAAILVRLTTVAGAVEANGGRTGDGTVTLVPLSAGRKFVNAWRADGSDAASTEVIVPSTAVSDVAWYRVKRIDRLPGAPYKNLVMERVERPIEP